MIYLGTGPPRSKLAQDKESAGKGGVHRLRLACRQSLDDIAPGSPGAGRPRRLYDGALLGMASVLLLDSLMGHKYSVFGFTAVGGMSACYGRETRLLVVTLAALMATDSLLPPVRPQDPATLAILVQSAVFLLDG